MLEFRVVCRFLGEVVADETEELGTVPEGLVRVLGFYERPPVVANLGGGEGEEVA